MSEKQKTIKEEISLSGVGLHSGKNVTITFKPAKENFGFKFKRIDLENQPIVSADIDNVIDSSRGTTIEENGAKISTIEHVLAALSGLEIDNVLIEIDGLEVPIMDGSSKFFIDALSKVGIIEQNAPREYIELKENIVYKDIDRNVEMVAIKDDIFSLSVMIDYNSKILVNQHAAINNIKDFTTEIYNSRTFVFLHELEMLLSNNLIKGGDLNNAIVIVDKILNDTEINNLSKLFNIPNVEVKKEGILNNVDLYYPNEPAKHKLLDVIGDLALLGKPLKAKIYATRPGHKANYEFAKLIKASIKNKDKRNTKTYEYDINIPPLYNINQISKILPHRSPFLLIDKILEMSNKHVVGLKNVTMNEFYFTGHFPDDPVMPGVLQVEAMAQTGGILALSTVPDPENYNTYFMKIDKVKFKAKVLPGDTLIFYLDLLSPIRRGICEMKGTALVGNKIVMEAELMAQIVRKK
ncbi:MAG: UDP-3-O-[3-hydroxymyristoyl] N-acetylglucosamine deacetylase [Bacteroidetes bacterium GWE2_29_8]|nr:MAG: UDP-3-O-[3-hydroxymyristoyl] N-acetylglucosamine deacetylase [Bacteroidetes bacterium GWE2_29_8]OFY23064.1 MAG: UDP-3-O-[3-hydroxymyristoyl] N-acetylglucosamine deacetylase [Bacteroidetes bacterium GWF2_29_10]